METQCDANGLPQSECDRGELGRTLVDRRRASSFAVQHDPAPQRPSRHGLPVGLQPRLAGPSKMAWRWPPARTRRYAGFLMGDGSVRFIKDSISQTTYMGSSARAMGRGHQAPIRTSSPPRSHAGHRCGRTGRTSAESGRELSRRPRSVTPPLPQVWVRLEGRPP